MRFPALLKIIFVCFLFFGNLLRAQDTLHHTHRNFNIELGGNGGIYSLNYENSFLSFGAKTELNWSAGLCVLPIHDRAIVDFPVGLNFLYGAKKHRLEFGTGQVLILDLGGGKGGTVRGTFKLGYRYENEAKHFYLLFAYTPFYSYIQNFQYENWGGITFGYYFQKSKR